MCEPKIPGGYILLSRKIIESEIWDKPPLYMKVWIYLLSKAQHKPFKKLDRGQLFVSIPELMEACSWYVGYRKEKPSKDQIYKVLNWLRSESEAVHEGDTKETMIETTKATHGLLVNISNYAFYQDPKNYEANAEATNEEQPKATREQRHPDNINKNVKNEKNDNKKRRKHIYDDNHFQLAEYFYNQILKNNPEHKKPNLEKWANDVRLMMDNDKRTEEQIKYLMKWVQQDSFEMSNVLSPSKLRERFDPLVMKVKKEKGHTPNKQDEPVERKVDVGDELNEAFM